MRPAQDIMLEHHSIGRMLTILEIFASRLEAGEAIPAQDLAESVGYLRGIIDRCHHLKEEQWLFPALEAIGVQKEDGPIGLLLEQHRLVRNRVQVMARAAQRLGVNPKDASAAAEFAHEARAYCHLVRLHMQREESGVLSVAEDRLSAEEQDRLQAEFDRITAEEMGPTAQRRARGMLTRLEATYL